MAAYAALVSLFNTLDHIKNHPHFAASLDKHQIETLGQNLDFLLDFLESDDYIGSMSREAAEELEAQIALAAHEAEDVIETYIVDQILPASTETISAVHFHRRCLFDLQKVILDIGSLNDKVLMVKEERDITDQHANSISAASSTPLITTQEKSSSMVGFEDELYQLKDVLTGQESRRQIISIVGMGGIGKTTLAKTVYEDSLIMHHFDLRAWATISQDFNIRDVLLQLLSLTNGTLHELAEQLHKRLFGRRYLIMLDDMWSVEAWNSIKFYFPDNGNGSRVVLTTRLAKLATDLSSLCITLNFLDEHVSWNLFCRKVFGREKCPRELVWIGKRIVEKCKGLSLSIVVIGGLLKKADRTAKYWNDVANNIASFLNSSESGQCLVVLYSSYSHLPGHLKPCFLYVGTFPEDHQISVSELIELWVAEGFLKLNGVQMLEEIAEEYLNDLVNRNLLLVHSRRSNGKIKACGIHDLLRELCLRVANKEKLFCVVTRTSIQRDLSCERRFILHNDLSFLDSKALQSASLVRSLIGCLDMVPAKCRLLRVFSKEFVFKEFDDDKEILVWKNYEIHNVNLRYLNFMGLKLPSSISLFWNLQTLINGRECVFVVPIWKMPQLRHLKCSRILLPDPPSSDEEDETLVLGALQTLTTVVNFRLSEDVCKRIPNIKKLHLLYGDTWHGYENGLYKNLQNIARLHKLESLDIWCSWTARISSNELKNAFPGSLNKLSLGVCRLDWEDLSKIAGSLPQLEVLKLEDTSSEVCTWNCVEGGFPRLKFLSIKFCYLKWWTLDSPSCFPVLEKLVLVCLWFLNEIPSDMGLVQTLQLIRLEKCSESAAISALKIKEEQDSFGNDGFRLQVMVPDSKVEEFRKRWKLEGLSINDVHPLPYGRFLSSWTYVVVIFRWLISIKRMVASKRKNFVRLITPLS